MSAADPAFEGYEGLVSALRANPPIAPDRLRQQVLAGEPRRRRLPSRRLVLVVVPVAVGLAVGAALVHGLVSSGSNKRVFAEYAPAPLKGANVATAGGSTIVHGASANPKKENQNLSQSASPATTVVQNEKL